MNKLIGITGKIGAGKSTLAQIIARRNNYHYVDVDEFRRNLFQNKSYTNELKNVIPELNKYNEINSIILNQYIYNNEAYMSLYKNILYKYLFSYLHSLTDKTILVDWALILTDHLEKYFNKLIYLDVPLEVRLSRLKNADLSLEEIIKRDTLQSVELNNNIFVAHEDTDITTIESYLNNVDCKFTIPNDGGKAIWEITHKCNYHCSYCIFSCNGIDVTGELTTEECYHVIDELVKHGYKHLKITGGEPFLRKDIIDILKYASKYMITDISTNASLITKELVSELNQIPLKMIHVSLDGDLNTHEILRGKNTYQATIKGLESLKNSLNYIRIGTIISSLNENDLDNIIANVIKYNAQEIIFSIMEPPTNKGMEYYKKNSNEELINKIHELEKHYNGHIKVNSNFAKTTNYLTSCPAGKSFIYINNYGQISPCTWVYEKDKSMLTNLSLRNTSLEKCLEEPQIKKFLKLKKECQCYGKIH